MKKSNFIIIQVVLIAILLLGFNTVRAENDKAGTSAYSFLRVGVSARAQAMAGAMVGLANDEYAGYYNPAGLGLLAPVIATEDQYGDLEEIESGYSKYFAASYNNYIAGIQSGYVTYITRQGYGGMLGFSIDYFNYGEFDETNADNVKIGTFGASEIAFGLNFGQRVDEKLYWGISGKFIYQKLQDYSSDGLALDGGIIYKLGDNRTQFGGAVKNIGVQLKGLTSEHKDNLPASIQAGFSHRLRGAPILFAGQVDYPLDYDISLKVGLEWSSFDPLLIRLGWDSSGKDYDSGSSKDKFGGLSGGIGYQWNNYSFDYSYSSFADLGDSHRIGISGRF